MTFLLTFFITLIACLILVPLLTALGKFFCLFAIVQECEAHVFLLFGRVIGVIDDPGLYLLALKIGPHALLIRFFGAVRRVDCASIKNTCAASRSTRRKAHRWESVCGTKCA